jgi:hypothetical protein
MRRPFHRTLAGLLRRRPPSIGCGRPRQRPDDPGEPPKRYRSNSWRVIVGPYRAARSWRVRRYCWSSRHAFGSAGPAEVTPEQSLPCKVPHLAVAAPADRILQAIVAPEELTPDGERRRTNNAQLLGRLRLSHQAIMCRALVCNSEHAAGILANIAQAAPTLPANLRWPTTFAMPKCCSCSYAVFSSVPISVSRG